MADVAIVHSVQQLQIRVRSIPQAILFEPEKRIERRMLENLQFRAKAVVIA